jgi:CRP-like cAMP-binding protein
MARFIPQGCGRRNARKNSLHLAPGATLFDPDHPPKRVFLLDSGHIQLSSSDGQIVDYLTTGDFFGEKCFLTPLRSGQVARILSPATVTAFRKSELLDRFTGNRRFATRVLSNLALRLDRYEQALGDFANETVERRLVRLLLRLTRASEVSGLVRLPFNLTNSQLAKTIGTTRWHVSHFMARLQQLGLLRRHEGIWVDRERLGTISQAGLDIGQH